MKKHITYLRRIYRMSLLRLKTYPLNFSMGSITRFAYMVSGIGALYFTYHLLPAGGTIRGATFIDSTIILLSFQCCFYFVGAFHFNGAELTGQIHRGELDTKLISPLSSFYSILLQELYPHSLKSTLYTFILLTGVCFFYRDLSALEWGYFLMVIASSFLVLSSLNLCFSSIAFFSEGFGKSPNWFKDQASLLNRYPKEIYPVIFQWVFAPIFFIVNPLFQILRHSFTLSDALIQIIATMVCLFLTVVIWTQGLKNYGSAN